jgi:hypothetical protein
LVKDEEGLECKSVVFVEFELEKGVKSPGKYKKV